MEKYDFKKIEKKWTKIFASQKFKENPSKKNFYLLEMFPYPSGALHMGHMRNYTIGDTYKRFLEMNGYNVIYPMGYDAFGLPAENAAIKSGVNPQDWTLKNIEKMISQQKQMGLSYQWDRLVVTCREDYYKWNQWFFLKFLEKGLAYRKKAPINWCPNCKTVLANEQVISGKCWRCETPVETRHLEQWFLKTTAYAEELLEDIEKLDWPSRVKIQQKNWLGKSEGIRIKFPLTDRDETLDVFTTRPDTLWGATFLAVSAEHPILKKIADDKKNEIEKMRKLSLTQSEEEKEKFGVRLNAMAQNPVTGEKIPIFAANFVLMEYGTGAIMCVPAHDKRDFAFARKYNLPIKVVILPPDGNTAISEAYTECGKLIDSPPFSGKNSGEAMNEIMDFLEKEKIGKREIQWKLKDWLISRQRYWGTPIPVVYCPKCGVVPVSEKDLPVKLPPPSEVPFTGEGNPLEKCPQFYETTCPKCGGPARRETDTLDTFFDSSWYFFRYLDSKNEKAPFASEKIEKYLPVDQYIGGIEHATMHLIYARFFTKVLRDLGLVKISEPFKKLLCQGMVIKNGAKMSKSLGNIVSVDEVLEKWGADASRMFILFASPPEKDLDWQDAGIRGSFRFVKKFWDLAGEYLEEEIPDDEEKNKIVEAHLALTIKKVRKDIETFQFNTAIAALQEFLNLLQKNPCGKRKTAMKDFVKIMLPFAPYAASEIAERFSIDISRFPEEAGKAENVLSKTIVIQVNGKMRGKVSVKEIPSQEEIWELAQNLESVRKHLNGEVKKKIYVPGKILNIVI